MRITKSGDGVRVRLNMAESHVLEQLFQELQGILAPGSLDGADPVHRRLYPAAYADAAQEQAFRELTESTLHTERSQRLDACLADLRRGRSLVRTEVVLDADATERWLRVLNDLRLSFGTRLGITDDDDNGLDERDPQVGLRARYLWLTALQDVMVTTVMG